MKICYLLVFALLFGIYSPSYAQVFDDEDSKNTFDASSFNNVDDNEAFFNELFKEFSPDERDINAPAEFNDAITEAAEMVKSYSDYIVKQESLNKEDTTETRPLDNDIHLSIVGGSFRIFKNIAGKMQCHFSVKLKSEIDRDIKIIGLSLAYPKRSFAFIFRNIPPQGELVQGITTRGDICYNLSGAPDINVNKCKIKDTKDEDCVSHIKWDDGKQKGL